MRLPFESEGAKILNRDIFETMYFAAMTASCELAEKEGVYETFDGSPVSRGILQFDMWGQVRFTARRIWLLVWRPGVDRGKGTKFLGTKMLFSLLY